MTARRIGAAARSVVNGEVLDAGSGTWVPARLELPGDRQGLYGASRYWPRTRLRAHAFGALRRGMSGNESCENLMAVLDGIAQPLQVLTSWHAFGVLCIECFESRFSRVGGRETQLYRRGHLHPPREEDDREPTRVPAEAVWRQRFERVVRRFPGQPPASNAKSPPVSGRALRRARGPALGAGAKLRAWRRRSRRCSSAWSRPWSWQ